MLLRQILLASAIASACAAVAAVEVNSASASRLQQVEGIDKNLSKRIVKERADKGPFKDWQDLANRVSGLGESGAQKASDRGLTVRGSTYTPQTKGQSPQQQQQATKDGTPPAAVAPADSASKEQASTPVQPPAIGAQPPTDAASKPQ